MQPGARRIICIGNRLLPRDAAALAVHDRLVDHHSLAGVDVIDGGLAGIDLLRFVEGAERVVFVDTAEWLGEDQRIGILDPREIAASASGRFDHAAGLPFLLRCVDQICQRDRPEIAVVGISPSPDDRDLQSAAQLTLLLARGEIKGARRHPSRHPIGSTPP